MERAHLYRESSLDRIQSPEQLNDYLRVTNPSVWVLLTAVILLLAGLLVWGSMTYIDSVAYGKAEVSQGRSYMGLIGMNLTNGEAEFAGLSEYESDRLLQAGLAAWNELFGEQVEKPVAFIPPTWYSNNFLCKQVRKLGILFEDRFSITTMRGNRYASLVTSFAGIPDFLIKPAFKFGELILKIPVGLPRIALHPVDFPTREWEVRDILRTALGSGRKLARYADL